jgi:hypothetical protein
MTISKEPIHCKLGIDGRIVKQVMEFNYLVVNIITSGNLEKEIETQVFFYLQNKMYNPCFTMRYTTGDLQYWYV